MTDQEYLPGFSRVRGMQRERPIIPTCGAHHPAQFKLRCQRPVNHTGLHCKYKRSGLADIEEVWS